MHTENKRTRLRLSKVRALQTRADTHTQTEVQTVARERITQYLAEDCQLLTDIGRRSLRSADVVTCATKRTRTNL